MTQTLACPKCRSPISRSADNVVTCPQCGTRYRLHPRTEQSPVLMPAAGRGVVDCLTVPNESVIRNRPLLKTYIPADWRYACSLDGSRFDLVSNPFVMTVTFCAPDDSAEIIYTGESFYKHIDYTPQTAMLQNRLEDLTVTRTPTFFRLKSTHDANAYCDALAQSCGLYSLSVISEAQPDETERAMQQQMVQRFLQQGFLDVSASWAGKAYRGTSPSGQTLMVYSETRVIRMMRISTVPTVQMVPTGGMFGMRMIPQTVNVQQQDHFWYTPYEFTLIATEAAFDSALAQLQKISRTLDALPAMEEARADAMRLAGQTVGNIAQAQSASFDRRSKIIADANAYTADVQHQIFQSNASAHDRAANRQSEMLREVNTYRGSKGVVEASTRWDHVYQSKKQPDLYAAQEGSAVNFGVDFEELKKTDGSY